MIPTSNQATSALNAEVVCCLQLVSINCKRLIKAIQNNRSAVTNTTLLEIEKFTKDIDKITSSLQNNVVSTN